MGTTNGILWRLAEMAVLHSLAHLLTHNGKVLKDETAITTVAVIPQWNHWTGELSMVQNKYVFIK